MMSPEEASNELLAAMREHSEAWERTKHLPLAGLRGPVAAANERIGCARQTADMVIWDAGLWPEDRKYIGNDECLRLLEAARA